MIKKLFSLLSLIPLVISAQFIQSFDDAAIPSDWTVINGGDSKTWQPYTTYAGFLAVDPHSGARYAGIEYSSTAHSDYLVTPSFKVTAGVTDKFSFWAKNTGVSFAEQFDLVLSETTATASAFTTTVASAIKPPNSAWTQYTYNLTPYIGKTIYLAFYIKTTNLWFVGIDDVVLTGNLAVSDIEKKLQNVLVYPNPVKDILKIQNQSGEKLISAEVYSMEGSFVKTVKLDSKLEANLSDLSKGIYVIKLKSDTSKAISIKFIKE